jgi:3-carboxy-cis,cis-muconate cycloisomerase
MLSLGGHIGRQTAHDVIYEAAQTAASEGKSFRKLLAGDKVVRAHLDEAQIEALLDPTVYTGTCAQFATEQAARARALAAELKNSG